jgi:hypothetical protein
MLKPNGGGVASTDGEKAFYRASRRGPVRSSSTATTGRATTAPVDFEIKGTLTGLASACREDLQLLPPARFIR